MSLEKAIEANTAAVLELCGLIKQEIAGNQAVREVIAAATGKVVEAAEQGHSLATPTDDKPVVKEVVTAAEGKPVEEEKAASVSSQADPVAALKYCQDLAMRLFNEKGRETCMQVLARFGVAKVSQLLEDQHGVFIAKAQAVLGGADV